MRASSASTPWPVVPGHRQRSLGPPQVRLGQHDQIVRLARHPEAVRVRRVVDQEDPQVGLRRPARAPARSRAPRPGRPARAVPPCRAASAAARPGPSAPRSRRGWCPATSEVSAASRRASAFSSVDLPTFGRPTSATSNPSRTRSAIRLPRSSCCIAACNRRAARRRRREHVVRQLLVGEVDGRLDEGERPHELRAASPPPAATAPRPSARSACRCCAAVSAASRSPSPSTCARSSRPFSSARRVNSPGSAGRSPSMRAKRRQHRPARPPGCHAAATPPRPRR